MASENVLDQMNIDDDQLYGLKRESHVMSKLHISEKKLLILSPFVLHCSC